MKNNGNDVSNLDNPQINLKQISYILVEIGQYIEFENINYTAEKMQRLANLNLIYVHITGGGTVGGSSLSQYYSLTEYGQKFIKYILN